jgi:hypothetical protein
MCAAYYARRLPHWIAIGSRLWADQMDKSPLIGHSLAEELMVAARHEIALRGNFTRHMLGELAERHSDLPMSVVLVDCTQLGAELMREGCRDVDKDIERSSRFVHGVDAAASSIAIAQAITRISDHLLEVVAQRPAEL